MNKDVGPVDENETKVWIKLKKKDRERLTPSVTSARCIVGIRKVYNTRTIFECDESAMLNKSLIKNRGGGFHCGKSDSAAILNPSLWQELIYTTIPIYIIVYMR